MTGTAPRAEAPRASADAATSGPPLRIALVGHEPSIHVQRWAGWLAGRGHDVHVVTCGSWDGDGDWTTHDLGRPASRAGYFGRIAVARRALRAIDPDLVHAHHVTSYGMLARQSRLRCPLVATCHGSDVLVSPSRSLLLRRIVRSVLRSADAITAPADHVAAAAMRVGGPGTVTPVVLQYGVEVARLAGVGAASRADGPARGARAGDAASPLRLVVARAHEPVYRNDMVIDAVAELLARGVAVHLDMYGGGSLLDEARGRVRDLDLDGVVRIHGAVVPEELERGIAAADACISAASSDGTSLALLETFAIGTPALCVRIPATDGWIEDGTTGLLCEPDARSMADAVERLRTVDVDALRAAALEQVSARADRDECLGEVERIYRALVGSRSPGGHPA